MLVQKSVLVGHSAQQMFALVDDVESYPRFLPWCKAATVVHRDSARTRATLHINYHGLSQSFTTDNTKDAPRRMSIQLVEGPFRVLDGEWRFTALGDRACKIEFRLHYDFASRILEKLVGPLFTYIANTLVDAFVARADQIHGE